MVEDARAAVFREDPLLTTALSRLVSVSSSVIKRHGSVLEGAIADALESSGRYMILRRQRLPITAEGRTLAEAGRHDEEVLEVTAVESWVDADLIVLDKYTGHLLALQIKRGGGKTDMKKRRQIEKDLRSARPTFRAAFAKERPDLEVRSCDVRIVDVYGGGGFDPGLTILGEELDAAFDMPVQAWITATTSALRAALAAMLPELLGPVVAALGEREADDQRAPRSRADLIGLPSEDRH